MIVNYDQFQFKYFLSTLKIANYDSMYYYSLKCIDTFYSNVKYTWNIQNWPIWQQSVHYNRSIQQAHEI